MLAQLPACRAEPACAQVTDARAAELRRPGQVQILNYEPSTRLSLTRRVGSARVAWRAGDIAAGRAVRARAARGPAHRRRRDAARALRPDRARERLLAAARPAAARHVRMRRPAQRARVGVAELGWPRRRVLDGSASGSGTPPVGRGLGLEDGSRSLPPPPPPSSSSGGFHDDVGVRAEEHHEEDHAERQRDDVERTEDHHQLFIGRHDEILPLPAGRATTFRYHRLPLMAAPTDTSTTLDLTSRAAEGSRSARRLRRTGQVPGVIYGGDGDAELFAVDGRILRNTLARSGAILEISVDGGGARPGARQGHPAPSRARPCHARRLPARRHELRRSRRTVMLELSAPTTRPASIEGGVLSQGAIELNIEALPGDIPDAHPVRRLRMEMNATATLSQLTAPAGVTLLDDPDETVLATITPPSQEPVEEEIETETEVVGEGEAGRRGRGPGRGRGRADRVLRRVLKLFSSAPVDWLVVGLGNPGARYADTPHNVGFQVADALIARWDLPKPKKKFAGELTEGRTGPGGPRVAVLKPQTYMNDAGRSVGPARGSFKLDLDRVLVDPRRDRPAVRRHPRAARRRARRPQRPQVAQARARLARTSTASASASAGPTRPIPSIVSAHVLGQVAPERRRGARARRARARRGRARSIAPYVITYERMPPRDWDAATYERVVRAADRDGHRRARPARPRAATRPCSTPAAGPATSRGCCSSGCRAAA